MRFDESSLLDDESMEINITPLIDIVFLLLIFFMVSTTFVESAGIRVALPAASSTPVRKEGSPIQVSVSQEGSVFVGESEVPLADLTAILRKKLAAGAEPTLVVRADRAANHGTVVRVMDLARSAGMSKLAVAVTPDTK